MSILTMNKRTSDWLKREAEGWYSREEVTILAGSGSTRPLTSGMLLEISEATAVGAVTSGNTGAFTITAAPSVSAGAKAGTYNLRCVKVVSGAGDFEVRDPSGNLIGIATTGVEFAQGGLTFTITDGSPDAAIGDTATIVVSAPKLVQMTATGECYGILLTDVTAADGTDATGVAIVRDAEINDTQVTWPTGIATALKNSEKARMAAGPGIVFRTGV